MLLDPCLKMKFVLIIRTERERERCMRYYYESRKNIPYISYVTDVREYIQKKKTMIMSYLQGTLKY